ALARRCLRGRHGDRRRDSGHRPGLPGGAHRGRRQPGRRGWLAHPCRPAYDGRRGNLYADPATWRAFAYLLILAVVAPLWLGALALAGLFEFVLLFAPVAVHMSEGIVIGTWTLHSTGTSILLMVLGLALLPVFVYAVSLV